MVVRTKPVDRFPNNVDHRWLIDIIPEFFDVALIFFVLKKIDLSNFCIVNFHCGYSN